jgi:hypothetical protein
MSGDYVDIEDAATGFSRSEMYSVATAGTAKTGDVHLFVVYGKRDTWPDDVCYVPNVAGPCGSLFITTVPSRRDSRYCVL